MNLPQYLLCLILGWLFVQKSRKAAFQPLLKVCVCALDTESFEAERLTKDVLYRIMDKISLKYANIPKP